MSWVKDNVFGGAAKDAAKQQTRAFEQAQEITNQFAEQARGDVMSLFPQAQQTNLAGYQGALDVFNQSAPQQMQMAQQGNQNAQAALLAGLPQMNNAILGAPIDYSALQPQSVSYDQSLFNQQLPAQLQSILTPPQQEGQQVTTNVAGNQDYAGAISPFNFLGGTGTSMPGRINPALMRQK